MRAWHRGIALALALMIGVILAPLVRPHPTERVYGVAEVVAGVQQQPSAWAGRTVLVRGVERGVQTVGLCATAGSCPQTTWLSLGPTASGGGAGGAGPQPVVARPARREAVTVAVAARRSAQPRAAPIPVILTLNTRPPGLSVLLGAGARPPAAQSQRPLPPALYTLPGLGPVLGRLFPGETTVTVRVRLTPGAACAADSPGPCTASILVGTR